MTDPTLELASQEDAERWRLFIGRLTKEEWAEGERMWEEAQRDFDALPKEEQDALRYTEAEREAIVDRTINGPPSTCPLTCVVPEQPERSMEEDYIEAKRLPGEPTMYEWLEPPGDTTYGPASLPAIGEVIIGHYRRTLVGQQVTLVLAPPPDLRGGTGVRNMELGTATVVNVLKVWREELPYIHAVKDSLLMDVEVKPCCTD